MLDDGAALFARHLYFALVQGHTVRESFEMGTAALASAAPSHGLPTPLEESAKFVLLPTREVGKPDPHDLALFSSLPPGRLVDLHTLPELSPPYVRKPFLGRALELWQLVLKLGQRRQKEASSHSHTRTEHTARARALGTSSWSDRLGQLLTRRASPDTTQVRLVTLTGPAGVGKSCLAVAAASHLFERRWYPDGCVCVDLTGRRSEDEVVKALGEELDMEMRTPADVSRALRHWRGLLVLDNCDAARRQMSRLLDVLCATQELRVLTTARTPLGAPGENLFPTAPLRAADAAKLFRELAMEKLPKELRDVQVLMSHPVIAALHNLPKAIWQTAPLLRQGKTLSDLERDLREHEISDLRDQKTPSASPEASPPVSPCTKPNPSAAAAELLSEHALISHHAVPHAASVPVPVGAREAEGAVCLADDATRRNQLVASSVSSNGSVAGDGDDAEEEHELFRKSLRRSLEVRRSATGPRPERPPGSSRCACI